MGKLLKIKNVVATLQKSIFIYFLKTCHMSQLHKITLFTFMGKKLIKFKHVML